MVITTILAYFVSRDLLGWSRLTAGTVTAAFLAVDLAFFGANMFKVADGGWFPLVIAAVLLTLMMTWRRGRQILIQRMREGSLTPEGFLKSLRAHAPVRVPGTAVFLSHLSGHIPDSLLHSLKHYKVLHEQVLILTVVADEVSRVDERERTSVEPLGEGLFRVVGRHGYMEHVNVPALLERITDEKLKRIDPMDTTYIVGVHRLILTKRPIGMALWRQRIFASMMRNASRPAISSGCLQIGSWSWAPRRSSDAPSAQAGLAPPRRDSGLRPTPDQGRDRARSSNQTLIRRMPSAASSVVAPSWKASCGESVSCSGAFPTARSSTLCAYLGSATRR